MITGEDRARALKRAGREIVLTIDKTDLDDFEAFMNGREIGRAIPARWWRARTALTGGVERNTRRD